MKRVVITGMGMWNSLGEGLDTTWRRLVAGDNGIAPISLFDASAYRTRVAAEVRRLEGQGLRDTDGFATTPEDARRSVQIFQRAAMEAWRDSGLGREAPDPARAGVAAGASVAYIDHEAAAGYHRLRRDDGKQLDLSRFAQEGHEPCHTFSRRLGDWMAALPAAALGLRGPAFVIDTACAASGHAIGKAFRLIRRGRASVMLAGGASAAVSPIGILYFSVLGALSRNPDPDTASRPFDRQRDGFVMGEGGGVVVLEELGHARARGARIYAELAGFAATTSAANLTDPSPEGRAEADAMRLALHDASMRPDEVGYIAAHGTSTPKNDLAETQAIHAAFGSHARRLLVSSNKAQIGHTIAGAAVSNLIAAVMAIREGVAPPTMHLHSRDPELDLDYVPNASRRACVQAALANSFAFGGQNAVLVVRACS